jgi:hypothetical protein
MKNIPIDALKKMYLDEHKSPYEISCIFNCNHKTVRRYLKLYGIPLRSASDYNYFARVSHSIPSKEEYMTPKSAAAHAAYLCEGWHTDKTDHLEFCNTDPKLCELIIWCLNTVYHVKTIRLVIVASSKESALSSELYSVFPTSKIYTEDARKKPILRIHSGGKRLAKEFIKNAYDIITS